MFSLFQQLVLVLSGYLTPAVMSVTTGVAV
jgi:hypothetical protein